MYPSVDEIGKQLTEEEFYRQRLSAAGWVHNPSLVGHILSGNYTDITPLHVELCSTYLCNFNCPWCSCRKSRTMHSKQKHTLTYTELCRILNECALHHMGVQWTGGEPLLNPDTVKAIGYGTLLGIRQCLFTNGSLLDEKICSALLESNLTFIRISLNCADIGYHQSFHGGISFELSASVLKNLEHLCQYKYDGNSKVQIGISLVIDSNNIQDFPNSVDFLAHLADQYPHSIDYIVIRAVNDDFDGIESTKDNTFNTQYHALINGPLLEQLSSRGISVTLPNDTELPEFECRECLGCSVFSEIAPDGMMFICSDQYGNRDYGIGNILENDVDTIWQSDERAEALYRHKDCFRQRRCPHYSRGWYFNMIIEQIERYRTLDQMHVVSQWISELQQVIPDLQHSFFI